MSGLSEFLSEEVLSLEPTEPLINSQSKEYERVETIPGDYNMEIETIVHMIFLYSEASDIIKFTRVSKTWRRIGTTDLLWSYIVGNMKSYVPNKSQIGTMVFFYDVKHRKEDIYVKVINKFQRAHDRRERVRTKRKRDEIREYAFSTCDYILEYLLFFFAIFGSFVCPPIGVLCAGILGARKSYDSIIELEDFGVLFLFSIFDTIVCTICTLVCTVFLFVPGIVCGVINFFILYGKHSVYDNQNDRDPIFLYYLSPTLLFCVVTMGFGLCGLFCILCCCFSFCLCCNICCAVFREEGLRDMDGLLDYLANIFD